MASCTDATPTVTEYSSMDMDLEFEDAYTCEYPSNVDENTVQQEQTENKSGSETDGKTKSEETEAAGTDADAGTGTDDEDEEPEYRPNIVKCLRLVNTKLKTAAQRQNEEVVDELLDSMRVLMKMMP